MLLRHKFKLIARLWSLRYRFYALLVVFLLPALLFSGDANVKNNVPVDVGFKIVSANFLAQRIIREDLESPVVETKIAQGPKTKPQANTLLVEDGRLAIYDKDGNEITNQFTDSELYKLLYSKTETKIKENKKDADKGLVAAQPAKLESVETVVTKPENPVRKNWLTYSKYKIQTPIQYASLEDMYNKNDKGQFDYTKPIDQDPTDSPIQTKLKEGIVHLGSTVQPGEVGNSYIVGHSSNYSFVKSDYNYVFAAIESKSKPGEDFTIYDKDGRELKFCVFEALKIEDSDAKTAYTDFGNRRVVTLQTSILGWRDSKYQATHRWLTRGELCK